MALDRKESAVRYRTFNEIPLPKHFPDEVLSELPAGWRRVLEAMWREGSSTMIAGGFCAKAIGWTSARQDVDIYVPVSDSKRLFELMLGEDASLKPVLKKGESLVIDRVITEDGSYKHFNVYNIMKPMPEITSTPPSSDEELDLWMDKLQINEAEKDDQWTMIQVCFY